MSDDPEDEVLDIAKRLLVFVEAQGKLTAALEQVRISFDAGEDDWQHRLVQTFREYSLAISIDPKLIDPLQAMLNEVDQRIFKERRKSESKKGTPAPVGQSLVMSFAAAAVSILGEREEYHRSIQEALWAVSRAAGIERPKLENYRNNLHGWKYSDEVCKSAEHMREAIRPLSTKDILDAVGRLRTFGK